MSEVRRGVYLLPNIFTTASLFCGFYAIVRAIEQISRGGNNFRLCALAIIAAALFDGLDGRVARRTRTSSRFGMEYDSLCDLFSQAKDFPGTVDHCCAHHNGGFAFSV